MKKLLSLALVAIMLVTLCVVPCSAANDADLLTYSWSSGTDVTWYPGYWSCAITGANPWLWIDVDDNFDPSITATCELVTRIINPSGDPEEKAIVCYDNAIDIFFEYADTEDWQTIVMEVPDDCRSMASCGCLIYNQTGYVGQEGTTVDLASITFKDTEGNVVYKIAAPEGYYNYKTYNNAAATADLAITDTATLTVKPSNSFTSIVIPSAYADEGTTVYLSIFDEEGNIAVDGMELTVPTSASELNIDLGGTVSGNTELTLDFTVVGGTFYVPSCEHCNVVRVDAGEAFAFSLVSPYSLSYEILDASAPAVEDEVEDTTDDTTDDDEPAVDPAPATADLAVVAIIALGAYAISKKH